MPESLASLRCAVCLHLPPGDTDAGQAAPAITVMEGAAVCEAHIEYLTLPATYQRELEAQP